MIDTFNPDLLHCYSGARLAEFVLNPITRGDAAMPFIKRLNRLKEYNVIEEHQRFLLDRAEKVALETLKKQYRKKAEYSTMDNLFKNVHPKDHAAHIVVCHEDTRNVCIMHRNNLSEIYAALRKHFLYKYHDPSMDCGKDYLDDNYAIQCIKEMDQHIDNQWMEEAIGDV